MTADFTGTGTSIKSGVVLLVLMINSKMRNQTMFCSERSWLYNFSFSLIFISIKHLHTNLV
jgi:hypothetical protein